MIPSQMLKGVLEGCILEIIRKRETYAYEISKQLEKYGFGMISEGTIYPIILRLQKNELIKATLQDSNSGPKRKYYNLTEKGISMLNQFKDNWQELDYAVNQLLMGSEDNE
ncbi:transcriptional regulator, PadR family [Clostridium sp. USBA 49]|uniref:PadR family transcriptional regulator n=1 Tax=Clostridium TaxID=1485 RepID=UPI00099987A6|nr:MULTISPECIES: PadR family transcriptional regulator [Clostridium]SKA85207.1 transcriptional regulator, PadR family [Clostridium sp. USBA 49]